jgi:N-acetylmuramoyl-L-alanine amidase
MARINTSIYKLSLIGFWFPIWCLLPIFGTRAQSKGVSPQEHYKQVARKYLVKNSELEQYFSIDAQGIAMYASPADKKNKKPECLLYWNELAPFRQMILHNERKTAFEFYSSKGNRRFSDSEIKQLNQLAEAPYEKRFASSKPLGGLRIAIDPGHIASDMEMAKIESRFVELRMPDGSGLSFCEGDLTLSTALLIKEKLEKDGAVVFLTRSRGNTGADGLTFREWRKWKLPSLLKEKFKGTGSEKTIQYWTKQAPEGKVYQEFFLKYDLDLRASLINQFQPDLTVVIHFNAAPKKPVWDKPVNENFNMVFMPGAFLKNELSAPQFRYDFMRMLILDNLNESARFSGLVLDEFVRKLNVPAIPEKNDIMYLNRSSIFVRNGVYARNLGLCRLINSPMCYGESLYQDNVKEAVLLSKNDSWNNKPAWRITRVADAYYDAISTYFKSRK